VSREVIATYGTRGNRRVLVIRDKARQLVYVERYVGGKAKRKPRWPLTRDNERLAKAWAAAYHKAPAAEERVVTVRDVWNAYWALRRDGLRPRTQILYAQRWRRFEDFVQPDTPAERVTLAVVDEFWLECVKEAQIAPNQARACITVAKLAYRWAESRDLIRVNKVSGRCRRASTISRSRLTSTDRTTPSECSASARRRTTGHGVRAYS
jgi:hypothetical protein